MFATIIQLPGLFIEEMGKFPPSIVPVETAIPAFIGYTQKAHEHAEGDLVKKAKKIDSLIEFEQFFGNTWPEACQIKLIESNNPLNIVVQAPTLYYFLYQAIQLYFDNGGGACYVVSAGLQTKSATLNKADFSDCLTEVRKHDECTLLVMPDVVSLPSNAAAAVMQEALLQCADLSDRFTIIDVAWASNGSLSSDIQNFRDNITNDHLTFGAAYYPYLKTNLSFNFNDETQLVISQHLLLDGTSGALQGKHLQEIKTDNPLIYNQIVFKLNELHPIVPPSGAVAGAYAGTDRDRGVWKAPSNISLSSISEPTVVISDVLQSVLTDPSAGKYINAIRMFTGKGTVIWGARTLAGNDNEWRYVSVRRFFNMVEESCKKETEAFVFEPNDANTWVRVQAMIENFLTGLWRAGALQGNTPSNAFYVKVGLGKTMTALDVLEGRMIIEIGMAVIRPSEFVLLRFLHQMLEA